MKLEQKIVGIINNNLIKLVKIMNFIIVFLLTLLLTSCQGMLNIDESDYKNIADFGRQAKREYNMQLVGLGGGYRKGVETFNLTFFGFQNPTLDEARVLFYCLLNAFLDKINADEKLKEKSNVDLFTIENIDLRIMFPEATDQIRGVGNGEIDNRKSLQFIYFFTRDPETDLSEITYKEPYEELKSIVESQLQHKQ